LTGHPVDVAKEAAMHWQQVVVLKGATTVIADPEGRVRVNDFDSWCATCLWVLDGLSLTTVVF
jgi:NAD(P)H-hydrate repair Nnr-like enzyme with NAD(P)H-hydrate dehydratase domain